MDEAGSNPAPQGADDPKTPEGPGVENAETPTVEQDAGVDPAARDESAEADAASATQTSQEVPAEQVEQQPSQAAGNPADQVHRDAPPPADWQSGNPEPGDAAQDRAPTQTAGGSTDGLSAGTQADEGEESEESADPNPDDTDR